MPTWFPEELMNQPISFIKLITKLKIQEKKLKNIGPTFVVQEGANYAKDYYHVRIGIESKEKTIDYIGYLGYYPVSSSSSCLRIGDIHNESCLYTNIGKLLIEYAFLKSIALGKEGRIELRATSKAVYFYIKLGFVPLEASQIEINRLKNILARSKKKRIESEQSYDMYLPNSVILQKKKEFGIEQYTNHDEFKTLRLFACPIKKSSDFYNKKDKCHTSFCSIL